MAKERCVTIRPAWRWRGSPLRRYAEDVRRGHRLEDAMARARPAEHRFHHLRPLRENDIYPLHPGPEARSGRRMWKYYYERWGSALVPELARSFPPARTYDKHVYSPWTGRDLHEQLRSAGIDTVIITVGETDVCVLAPCWARSTGAFALSLSPTRSAVRRMKMST
jgi:hypothetical protein